MRNSWAVGYAILLTVALLWPPPDPPGGDGRPRNLPDSLLRWLNARRILRPSLG